jgi:hypothetical protein
VGLSFLEMADVIKGATAVVTYSTGLGVLASGVLNGSHVPLVCMFDGEVPWEIFRLPGATTCSPDEPLPEIVLRLRTTEQLEESVARIERDRRARVKTLTADLRSQQEHAGHLQDALEHKTREVEHLLRTLADIEASKSWRWTRPLRAVFRVLSAGRP